MTLLVFILTLGLTPAWSQCVLTSDTNVVLYADKANGAYPLWYSNFFAWWSAFDSRLKLQNLTGSQIAACNLASYTNLRIFVHPGGNAYTSLSALGASGVANVRNFINRNQVNPSAYVASCAGSFAGAYAYLWETMYEGPGYFNFATSPPYNIFPYIVEGSQVDISDDQFGSYESNGVDLYQKVNVSNGQKAIYWGGPTLGYNGVTVPSSDSNFQVILYLQDYYGYLDVNSPSSWLYRTSNVASPRFNVFMNSLHMEADQTACSSGCLPAGVLTSNEIDSNRAWLATYVNLVANTSFNIPTVAIPPVFNTTAPHTSYPTLPCYTNSSILFCDTFTAPLGTVYTGMFQWQRNQTLYNKARPWNVTFTGTLMGRPANAFGVGKDGASDGFAITIPNTPTGNPPATILSKPFSTVGATTARVTYSYKGATLIGGYFRASYVIGGNVVTNLRSAPINPAVNSWITESFSLPVGQASVQLRFACVSGTAVTNYCAVDSVYVLKT